MLLRFYRISQLSFKYFSLILFLAVCGACAEPFGTAQHEDGEELPTLVSEAIKGLVYIKASGKVKEYYSSEELLSFYYGGGSLSYKSSTNGGAGGCSGFIIDLEKGYIVTNEHCADVDELDYMKLKLENGKTYDGKIIWRDLFNDVAVVAIADEKFDRNGLTQLRFGDSEALQLGEEVFALGAPAGHFGGSYERTITAGVVSGLNRPYHKNGPDPERKWAISTGIQIDAKIMHGNSGGPLLNMAGEVVGINSLLDFAYAGYDEIYGAIGFAVAANTVKHIVKDVIATGTHAWGYIAVEWQEWNHAWKYEEIRSHLQLEMYPELTDGSGVLIRSVHKDTSAAKGGLLPGDVVFAIGEQRVTNKYEAFNAIAFTKPGTKLAIHLLRDGKIGVAHVEVEQLQTPAQRQPLGNRGHVQDMEVAEIRQDSRFYRQTKRDGLLVLKAPSLSGLTLGDFIVTMDDIAVNSIEQFQQYLEKREEVLLYVEHRAGNYRYVLVKKDKKKEGV